MQKYINDMKQTAFRRSSADIFPPALRSLWNPITPSPQAKICSTTDRPDGNIYY